MIKYENIYIKNYRLRKWEGNNGFESVDLIRKNFKKKNRYKENEYREKNNRNFKKESKKRKEKEGER